MQAARRLYLYVMSGITLAIVATGLVLLLRVLLDPLFPDPEFDGFDNARQQLSQAIAFLGVATPVWAVHWWLAQRGAQAGRPGFEAERGSAVRAGYFTLVLVVSLSTWFVSMLSLGRWLVAFATGDTDGYRYADPLGPATLLVVGLVIWLYHGLARRRDFAAGPLEGAAAWLPRLYLYGVAVVALFVALSDLGRLLTALILPIDPDFFYGRNYLLEQTGSAAAWAALWLGHWLYAGRLVADPARGAAERVARTRVAAIVIVIVGAAAASFGGAAEAIQAAIRPFLPEPSSGSTLSVTRIVAPAVVALMYGLVWAWHARVLRREPAAADPRRATHQDRLVSYGLSAVGLAMGATAAGWLIGYALDAVLGGVRSGIGFESASWEIGQWLSLAAVGLPVWAWFWRRVDARRRTDEAGEAGSTIRRTYVLLALGIAVVAAVLAAGVIVYRLVGILIDARIGGDVVSELSTPAGSLVVAIAVALFHGLALRRDQDVIAARRPAAAEAAPVQAVAATLRDLRLVGPAGADLDAVISTLRSALPDGIEIRSVGG